MRNDVPRSGPMWECSVMSGGGAFKKKIPWIAGSCIIITPAHEAGSAWQTCSSILLWQLLPILLLLSALCWLYGQQSSCSSQHRLLPPSFQKLHFDSHQSGLTTASLHKSSFMQVAVPTYCLPQASTFLHCHLGLGFSEPIRIRSFWFHPIMYAV